MGLLEFPIRAAVLVEQISTRGFCFAPLLSVTDLLDIFFGSALFPEEPGDGRVLRVAADLTTLIACPNHWPHVDLQVRQGSRAFILQASQFLRHILRSWGLASHFRFAALALCNCGVCSLCFQRLLCQICWLHSSTGLADFPAPFCAPPPQVFCQFAALRRRQTCAIVDLCPSLCPAFKLKASANPGSIVQLAFPIGRQLLFRRRCSMGRSFC